MNRAEQLRDLAQRIRIGCKIAPVQIRYRAREDDGACAIGAAMLGAEIELHDSRSGLNSGPDLRAQLLRRWPILAEDIAVPGFRSGTELMFSITSTNDCTPITREDIAFLLECAANRIAPAVATAALETVPA